MSKKNDIEIEVFEGEITKIEDSKDGNTVADRYLKEIIFTKHDIGVKFLYLGQLLHNVQEKGYYKQYADSYAEYIAMPEINMKLSTADNFKRVYKTFVKEWKIDLSTLANVGVSKCVALLERTDITEDTAEDWLAKALTLSHRDLLIECGSEEQVEFGGIVKMNLHEDDMGMLLEIVDAPNGIEKGLFRITSDGAVGKVKQVAYLKGRKTSG